MSASEAIFGRVARVVMESLNVDEDEVAPAASLQNDLGAESIDFLDIVFRLEREFGIKIPRGELFPESVFQGDPEFVNDGKVTDKGMAELRLRMPYADFGGLDNDRRLSASPICSPSIWWPGISRGSSPMAVNPGRRLAGSRESPARPRGATPRIVLREHRGNLDAIGVRMRHSTMTDNNRAAANLPAQRRRSRPRRFQRVRSGPPSLRKRGS